MHRKEFRLALTGTIGLLLAGGLSATEVEKSSDTKQIGLDTRLGTVRVIHSSQVDLLGLAYNNTTNWVAGGDSKEPPPTLRLVEMDAHGTPTLVTNWTDTIAITNLDLSDREGVADWVSDRKAFFRAELIVGSETNGIAYFDFSTCTDPGIRKTLSCFTGDQAIFLLRNAKAQNAGPLFAASGSDASGSQYVIDGLLYEKDGTPVGTGNYGLEYDSAEAVPGARLDILAYGLNSWGGRALFQGAPLYLEQTVSSNDLTGVSLDTRRKLVYVDDANGAHVDVVTLHVISNALTEVIDFAYNNTTNWVYGGDANAELPVVHVVEMDSHGRTDYPAIWTDSTCETNFPIDVAEGTRFQTSDRKAYYRAELIVGNATNAVVYFDFGSCTNAGIKQTLSLFGVAQIQVSVTVGPQGEWVVAEQIKDWNNVPLTKGVDYSLIIGDPLPIKIQGVGPTWGGRCTVPNECYHGGLVCSDKATAAIDTRSLTWRFLPESGPGMTLYWCRHPESADEVLPFAYDTNWVATATSIDSVSITAYAYGELDEGRREQITVMNEVGTGIWEPSYRGYYEARIVEDTPGGLVTNVVEIDLEEPVALPDYPGIDVAFADGTTTNLLTLQAALQVARDARAGGIDVESVNLLVDRYEDLTLQPGDDIVFDGTGHLLDGGFDVPDGAQLTIIGGFFTSNPESPVDYVPRGCATTEQAGDLWKVTCNWLIGSPEASAVKAYLTGGDDEAGTLKVIGAGDMKYWVWSWTKVITPPWEAAGYDASITNVVIGSRVTSVGSEAFRECVNLVSVTLPGTIKDIGRSAFSQVNTNAQGGVAAGFVKVTYRPARTGVPTSFAAKEMLMANGLLTGGTYSYTPQSAEVDPRYCVLGNGDGTWTVVEIWATIEREGTQKYGSGGSALTDVQDGETMTITCSTPHLKAEELNGAFAEKGFLIVGGKILDVWGTLTNGVYACPVRIGQYDGKAVAGEIAGGTYSNAVYASTNTISGGDFYGPVHAATNTISGGTFSECPTLDQIKAGYGIVETDDEPARYRVVAMVADGVPYPQVVAGLSYTGEPQTGVTVPEGVTKKTGTISETAVGIYTASFDPASGKCWPTGNTETVTLKWGIAPLLPGVQTGYDPVTEGWKITLTNDLTSPLEIPDSFGALVEGKVELDLNGHSIEIPKAVLPGETNGVSALRIIHDPAGYTGPALNLTITGPGEIKGGDGADGVPAHTAGGLGAAAIEIETGSRVTSNPPTVPATVTVTDGAKGTDYTGGDEPPDLLMTIIDSRDEFVAVAIPYANTNSPAQLMPECSAQSTPTAVTTRTDGTPTSSPSTTAN